MPSPPAIQPPSSRTRPVLAYALALLILAGVPLATGWAGPQEQEPLPSPLVERQEVRLVMLDLVAEEKVGRKWGPARGLTREQVSVYVGADVRFAQEPEETLKVDLAIFENWCRAGSGVDAPAAAAAPGEEPVSPDDADREVPDYKADAELPAGPPGVKYVLYFELNHLKLDGYRSAFKGALEWADENVNPEDEVMILTGGAGVRMVRPLLPASEGLREDLLAAREDYLATDAWAEWENVRNREIRERYYTAGRLSAEALANSFAQVDLMKTRRSLQNLRDIMAMFEAVEGTKNLVLFQETIRMIPGRQYSFGTTRSDIKQFLDEVVIEANERNVRFYPVDSAGMTGEGNPALHMLADETGGRFLRNTNRLNQTFENVEEDLSCFYRVGFYEEPAYSGTEKRIGVKIAGDGKYRIRHRQTLQDPTRQEHDADILLAALLSPETTHAFPISVTAMPLYHHDRGARIRLQVSAAIKDLLALPTAGAFSVENQIQVQLGGVVVRRKEGVDARENAPRSGAWSDASPNHEPWSFNRNAGLTVPRAWSADEEQRQVLMAEEFDAPPGDYRLVAVFQDRMARTQSAAVADFHVPEEPPALAAMHLAVADERMVTVGRPAPAKSGEPGKKPPADRIAGGGEFLLQEELLVMEEGRVQAGQPAEIVYGVCYEDGKKKKGRGAAAAAAEKMTWSRTLECDGSAIPLPDRPLPAPGQGEACAPVIESLPADALRPGRCRFEVTLEGPRGKPVSRALDFEVVPS